MCGRRLVFRCTFCNVDYMNKEGLWIHMNQHEIADESKELHCQQIEANHNLHQCSLCNDQRAYLESPYWEHIQVVHDGFSLRCSECGEYFRSETLMNDHTQNHCKIRDQTVTSESGDHQENDQVEPRGEQNNGSNEGTDSPSLGEESRQKVRHKLNSVREPTMSSGQNDLNSSSYLKAAHDTKDCDLKTEITVEKTTLMPIDAYGRSTENSSSVSELNSELILPDREPKEHTSGVDASCYKCSHCKKMLFSADSLKNHISKFHVPIACDICGITSSSRYAVEYHKEIKHKDSKYTCPHCSKEFFTKRIFKIHVIACTDTKFSCDFCDQLFKTQNAVNCHRRFCRASKATKKGQNSTKKQGHNSVDTIPSYPLTEDINEQNSSIPQGKTSDMQDRTDSSNVVVTVPQPPDDGGLFEITCTDCGNEFTSPVALYRHFNSYHEQIQCDICGLNFVGSLKHKNHLNTCHAEPRHVCPTCGKIFVSEIVLYLQHLPICKCTCQICGRRFNYVHTFEEHKLRDHPIEVDLTNVQIDQIKQRTQDIDVKTESAVEETSILSGQSVENPTSTIDAEHTRRVHDINGNVNSEGMDCTEEQNLKRVKKRNSQKSTAAIRGEISTLKRAKSDETASFKVSEKNLMPQVQNQSNGLPCSKCPHCGKDFPSDFIPRHIQQNHVPRSCNICGIDFANNKKMQYHRVVAHKEPKHKCPHCPVTFTDTLRYQAHVSTCERRKFPCDVCGQTFISSKNRTRHKKKRHQENGLAEHQPNQNETNVFTKDITKNYATCEKTLAGADELMDHKLICPEQPSTKHNDSQIDAEKSSLPQGLTAQTDATDMPQSENIELKLEFLVEDTTLQGYQVPNDAREKSSTHYLAIKQINNDKPKDVAAEDAASENRIKVKEEYVGKEEEILIVSQSTSEPAKRLGAPSDRNESHHGVAAELGPCSICGLTFENKSKMEYHMVVFHTEPRYKCSQCPKAFHFVDTQRRHEMIHRRIL